MKNDDQISIVVPTLNEAQNIPLLFERIDKSLRQEGITYEIIIIDDRSSDGTAELAEKLASQFPVRVSTKRGSRGKAYSLLEGFDKARYQLICMIDADLQYPPEAIVPMYKLLTDKQADVVISERVNKETSILRKISSKTFNFFFVKLLFGISYDTQSGLKLFRKEILNNFEMTPSPWSFDLEFLVRSLENKRLILSMPIPFAERTLGVTKVKILSTTFELAKASLLLRWNTSKPKVREGNRVNIRFLNRAFPVMATSLLLGSLLMFSSRAQALSLPVPPASNLSKTSASETQNLVSQNITSDNSENSSPSNSKSPTLPTGSQATPLPPPQHEAITTSPSPSPPQQTPTPQHLSSSMSSSTAKPKNTSSYNGASHGSPISASTAPTPQSVSTPAPNNSQLLPDNSKLAAATSQLPNQKYQVQYPTLQTNQVLSKQLSTFSKVALIVGGFCIITFLLLKNAILSSLFRRKGINIE